MLLPTPFYWQIGAEAFDGGGLSEGDEDIGVYTVNTRFGGDISRSQSWQAGLSYLRNRQIHGDEHGDEHEGEHEGEHATSSDSHEGWYVSAVYQFAPQWSAGVRYGQVDLKEAHGDHFDDQRLEETDVMLAWSHSHFSTVRLQYTHQEADGFEKADNTLMLQYVMSLGAHGTHGY